MQNVNVSAGVTDIYRQTTGKATGIVELSTNDSSKSEAENLDNLLASDSVNVAGSVDNKTQKENIDFTNADFEGSLSVNTKLLTAEGRAEIGDAYKNLPENLEKTGKGIADATGKGYELLPEGVARDTVEIANHLVADIIPLPTNNGGLLTMPFAVSDGEKEILIGIKIDGQNSPITLEQLSSMTISELNDNNALNGIRNAFWNGIMNPKLNALNNANEQLGNPDNLAIAYTPSHGFIPDALAAGWNKLFGISTPTGNLKQNDVFLGELKSQNPSGTIFRMAAHSDGVSQLSGALERTGIQLPSSLIQFSGGPKGNDYLNIIAKGATGKEAFINNNSGDFISNGLGGNADGAG